MKTKGTATYAGQRVIIVDRRHIPGGVCCDVKKPEDAKDWPWTVTGFSVPECRLEDVKLR